MYEYSTVQCFKLTTNASFFSSRRRIMNSINGVDTGTFSAMNI